MTTPGAQPTGSSAGEDRPSHLGRVHRPTRRSSARSWEPMRPSSRPPSWRPEQPVPRFRTWTYIRIQGWERYRDWFGFAEPSLAPAARYARTTREHLCSPGSAGAAGPLDRPLRRGRCRNPPQRRLLPRPPRPPHRSPQSSALWGGRPKQEESGLCARTRLAPRRLRPPGRPRSNGHAEEGPEASSPCPSFVLPCSSGSVEPEGAAPPSIPVSIGMNGINGASVAFGPLESSCA